MNKSTRITAMMFWALSLFGSVTLEAQTFTAQALEQTIVTPAQEGRYLWLPIQESAPEGKLQVIVSNVAQMEQNVLAYEPHLALFVPDNDPLRYYRAIADYARLALRPGGKLYLDQPTLCGGHGGDATSKTIQSH